MKRNVNNVTNPCCYKALVSFRYVRVSAVLIPTARCFFYLRISSIGRYIFIYVSVLISQLGMMMDVCYSETLLFLQAYKIKVWLESDNFCSIYITK